jgi:hypothetical protein
VATTWDVFQDGENSFDLSHLNDRAIIVRVGENDVGILVRFSDHCFTEEAVENDVRPKFPESTRIDGRFCSKRHAASLNIWDCLDRATKGTVWLGEDDRCLIVRIDLGDYIIPFTLEKFKGVKDVSLLMRVRSAFLKMPDRHIATFGSVRFTNLVDLTIKGKSPNRQYGPKRKRPW